MEKSPTATPEPAAPNSNDYLLSARCESAKTISVLLSCLKQQSNDNTKMQPLSVFCSPQSLAFHVMDKTKQCSVDMRSSLFSDYMVHSDDTDTNTDDIDSSKQDWEATGEFCINLTTLLEALHVLGTTHLDRTKVCISYHPHSQIFKLECCNDGMLSTAAIPGMVLDNDMDDDSNIELALAFRSKAILARVIVQSSVLQEIMGELDCVHGGQKCRLSIDNRRGGIVLSAVGNWGECEIIIPIKGHHVVSVDVPQPVPPHEYSLQNFMESMRGLDIAQETCISINTAGMVAIQHQVFDKTLSDDPCFVDFILCCLENEDENDDKSDSPSVKHDETSVSPQSVAWSVAPNTVDGGSTHAVLSQHSRASLRTQDNNNDSSDDNHNHDNSNNNDDEEDDSSSVGRLFGSVVDDSSRSTARNVRRRPRPRRQPRPAEPENLYHDESQALDVTAPASPKHRPRIADHDCSSPELEYGQQQ